MIADSSGSSKLQNLLLLLDVELLSLAKYYSEHAAERPSCARWFRCFIIFACNIEDAPGLGR